MDTLTIILLGISIFLVIELIILCSCFHFKYKKLEKEYLTYKREKYRNSNKMSMVEYFVRAYKEGKNIYTVMRDITDLVYSDKE